MTINNSNMTKEVIILIADDDAGHAADNAGITCELVRATDRFAGLSG